MGNNKALEHMSVSITSQSRQYSVPMLWLLEVFNPQDTNLYFFEFNFLSKVQKSFFFSLSTTINSWEKPSSMTDWNLICKLWETFLRHKWSEAGVWLEYTTKQSWDCDVAE